MDSTLLLLGGLLFLLTALGVKTQELGSFIDETFEINYGTDEESTDPPDEDISPPLGSVPIPVPGGGAGRVCVDSDRNCAYNLNEACRSVSGYSGNKATTKSGRKCQRWDSQIPHNHTIGTAWGHNFCRNPDAEEGPWCYTTDPKKRFELCFDTCHGSSLEATMKPDTRSELIVFGDGFTDNGIDPDLNDLHGLQRNSNGPVWSEYLAQYLFGTNCTNGWESRHRNFAYSGATSGWDNRYFTSWSGIQWQIDRFSCRFTGMIKENSTIIIQLAGLDEIRPDTNYLEQKIVDNLKSALRVLLKRNATRVIVLGLVDPNKRPSNQGYSYTNPQLSWNVQSVNRAVFNMIHAEKCRWKNQTYLTDKCYRGVYFTDNFIEKIEQKFPIKNATMLSAIKDRYSPLATRGRSSHLYDYMWYDDLHLSTMAHRELAKIIVKGIQNIGKAVKSIPKPEAERFSRETLILNLDRIPRPSPKLRREAVIIKQLKRLGYENLTALPKSLEERNKIIAFLQSPSETLAEQRRKKRLLKKFLRRSQ